jgi:hypothetical protein
MSKVLKVCSPAPPQHSGPRYQTGYTRVPFVQLPASNDEGPWHEHEDNLTYWLSLFYSEFIVVETIARSLALRVRCLPSA